MAEVRTLGLSHMLFTSPTFYLLFLPAFLLVFRLVSRDDRLTMLAKLVIVLGTYCFYLFENASYLIPFMIATLMDLLWSTLLRHTESEKWRRAVVVASVVQNLSLLAAYKYVNWLTTIFPGAAFFQVWQATLADNSGAVVLPPGISFYLFESMSFVIDCYRRRIESPRDPLNFLAFITMFPRFIAGPIVRYADLESTIVNYRGPRVANGLVLFASGFSLKILIADSFERLVSYLFGESFTFLGSWLAALSYTFQLYVDFSAYSMMAIGLGLTLGFPFADNFREPYHSVNVTEFWRRWHISLSTWLRDYLYISLGGNRGGNIRTYINLWLTMLLGGLWHGANATFVIWGAYHGTLLAVERVLRSRGIQIKSRLLTFLLVVFGWVYFRAKDAAQGERMVNAMIGLNGWGWSDFKKAFQMNTAYALLAFVGLMWIFHWEPRLRARRHNRNWHELEVREMSWLVLAGIGSVFLAAVVLSLANKNLPFLYFQF